jgi:hypothetical protein
MKFNLNRKIRFVDEVKHGNLYEWALQEITSDGKVVGRDQIPWRWTLTFVATGIRLLRDIKAKGDGTDAEDSESIQLELKAYDRGGYPPRFSMFGTDRTIRDFSLTVQRARADRPLQCMAWGFVSYETEERDTAPDTIGFEVGLPAGQFESLKATLLNGAGDHSILFSANCVSGFYSGWSPDIYPGDVKVLTPNREHDVTLPPNVDGIPRLGAVGEFTLLLARRPPASPWILKVDKEDSEGMQSHTLLEEGAAEPSLQANAALELLTEIKRLERSVMSLRLPLWLLLLVAAIAVLK